MDLNPVSKSLIRTESVVKPKNLRSSDKDFFIYDL